MTLLLGPLQYRAPLDDVPAARQSTGQTIIGRDSMRNRPERHRQDAGPPRGCGAGRTNRDA